MLLRKPLDRRPPNSAGGLIGLPGHAACECSAGCRFTRLLIGAPLNSADRSIGLSDRFALRVLVRCLRAPEARRAPAPHAQCPPTRPAARSWTGGRN